MLRSRKRDASNRRNLQDESKMFEKYTFHHISSSSSSSMKTRGLGVPSGPKLAVMSTMLPNRRSKIVEAKSSNTRRETLHAHTHTSRHDSSDTVTQPRMKIKTSPKRKILKLPRPTF